MRDTDAVRNDAIAHAIRRAKQEKANVVVYVSRHGPKEVWFVRLQDEGHPTDAEEMALVDANGGIVLL